MDIKDTERLLDFIWGILSSDNPENYQDVLEYLPENIENLTAKEFNDYFLNMPTEQLETIAKKLKLAKKEIELQWLQDISKILRIVTSSSESLEVLLKISEGTKYQDLLEIMEKNRLNLFLNTLDKNCDLIYKKEDGKYELRSFGKYFLDKFVKNPLKDYSERFPEK